MALAEYLERLGANGPTPVTSADGLPIKTPEFINVQVSYSKSDISATSWAVLIDLSDTVNWPHEPGNGIDISYMSLQVDKPANALGRFQVGVVTRVNATNGDVSVFRGIIFDKDDGAGRIRGDWPSPSPWSARVTSSSALRV